MPVMITVIKVLKKDTCTVAVRPCSCEPAAPANRLSL